MYKRAVWYLGITALVFTCFHGQAWGGFYKYVDKEGNVRFTDNLGNVPSGQRLDVEEYEGVETRPKPQPVTKEDSKGEGPVSGETPDEESTGERLPDRGSSRDVEPRDPVADRLQGEGEQLKKEYDALMEEKSRLESAASRRLTPSARRQLEKDIQDFNARIQDYDKRREAHTKAVGDYQISSQPVE